MNFRGNKESKGKRESRKLPINMDQIRNSYLTLTTNFKSFDDVSSKCCVR